VLPPSKQSEIKLSTDHAVHTSAAPSKCRVKITQVLVDTCSTQLKLINSGVSGQKLVIFLCNAERSLPLLMLPLPLQCFHLFRNERRWGMEIFTEYRYSRASETLGLLNWSSLNSCMMQQDHCCC